jgi:hypothetical protein
MPAAINPTPMPEGNLVQFLVSELAQRGVTPPQSQPLPAIQATWQTFEQDVPPKRASLGIMARDCSLQDLDSFFRSFFMLFATPDAQHFRDGGSFTFRTSEADFFFNLQKGGFSVDFPTLIIVVGQKDDAVMIHFIRK